jgi:hypothetical protein
MEFFHSLVYYTILTAMMVALSTMPFVCIYK